MATPQDISAAGEEFYPIFLQKLKNEKGVHAETAISAASRLAGTFMLRSFHLPIANLEPGTAVLSDAADEKGTLLIGVLQTSVQKLGVRLNADQIKPGLPPNNKPQLSIGEMQSLLEQPLIGVIEKYKLSYEEAAQAAAMTTAMLVKDCAGVLPPHVGFSIAVYGFVEGSKTVPRRLETGEKKPWYKLF